MGLVPSGSLFYNELLIEEENLPDSVFYNVPEGEVVVSFPVNTVSTYGNSIMPNNLINVSAKAHYVIHHLMYKAFPENIAMTISFKRMCNSQQKQRITAKVYEVLKLQNCKFQSENKLGKSWGNHSEESKIKISSANKR